MMKSLTGERRVFGRLVIPCGVLAGYHFEAPIEACRNRCKGFKSPAPAAVDKPLAEPYLCQT
jgi:hypothetical protein